MRRTMNATRGSITGVNGAGGAAYAARPVGSSMRVISRGCTTEPRLANAVYAVTSSSGLTADAPMALDGTGAIGEVMPNRCASAAMVSIPTRIPSWMATGLRDLTSASCTVIGPRNCPSAFPGW